jgi:hypothetical protein
MAKLKNIIKQLSEKDFAAITESLGETNAEKSVYLLKALRERQLSDNKIMAELEVNANAYYTLRSRLNQKIEEYLLQQMESPRTDILRKVANINEVVFTKKRAISIATLKKLEKELLDYDLSNELTIIYKLLKKLNVHSPEHFHYSQLYNRHVAYMLAVDKAEDLLADYFKKFGSYWLTGDANERLGLTLLVGEMHNVANLYKSHRLYVYQACMVIFHRLFVEDEDSAPADGESVEDMFTQIQKIFDTYNLDAIYYHLNLVFEFLKLEYYNHYRVYRQAEKYYEEVNDAITNLLTNYGHYTFAARFLVSKLERAVRLGIEAGLKEENESLFEDYETDALDVPRHTVYTVYRALSYFYAGEYEEAARLINQLLNEVSLKKYPFAHLEVKALLALQYGMLRDVELFNQLANSIQRQIRLFENGECENILLFLKILKIAVSDAKKDKVRKIQSIVPRFNNLNITYFAPTLLIRFSDPFIRQLSGD